MAFFDIFIRSKSDSSGLKEAAKATQDLENGLQRAGLQGTMFGRIVGGMGTVIRSPLALIGMGFTAVTAGIGLATKALREFGEGELADAKLVAAMKSMGVYTEGFRQKIQNLADEMKKSTLISDETWKAQLEHLIRFGATAGNIDQVALAVKNLAGLLGGDLQQATMLISRAMQGSYEVFGRYGIKVQDAGSQTEKLQKLFEQLAQRGGGAFEALNGTLSGKLKQLSLTWSEFWKTLGGRASETGIAQDLMTGLSSAIESVTRSLTKAKPPFAGLRDSASSAASAVADLKDRTVELEKAQKAAKLAADDLKEAQLELAKAGIDLQVVEGRMSEKDAALAKNTLERQYALGKLAEKKSAIAEELTKGEATVQSLKEDYLGKENERQTAAQEYRQTLTSIRATNEASQLERKKALKKAGMEGTLSEEEIAALEAGRPEDVIAPLEKSQQEEAALARKYNVFDYLTPSGRQKIGTARTHGLEAQRLKDQINQKKEVIRQIPEGKAGLSEKELAAVESGKPVEVMAPLEQRMTEEQAKSNQYFLRDWLTPWGRRKIEEAKAHEVEAMNIESQIQQKALALRQIGDALVKLNEKSEAAIRTAESLKVEAKTFAPQRQALKTTLETIGTRERTVQTQATTETTAKAKADWTAEKKAEVEATVSAGEEAITSAEAAYNKEVGDLAGPRKRLALETSPAALKRPHAAVGLKAAQTEYAKEDSEARAAFETLQKVRATQSKVLQQLLSQLEAMQNDNEQVSGEISKLKTAHRQLESQLRNDRFGR